MKAVFKACSTSRIQSSKRSSGWLGADAAPRGAVTALETAVEQLRGDVAVAAAARHEAPLRKSARSEEISSRELPIPGAVLSGDLMVREN